MNESTTPNAMKPEIPNKTRIVVLFGGQSAEHEVSCISAVHVLKALDRDRYDVLPVGIRPDGRWVRSDSALAMLAGGDEAVVSALVAAGAELEASVALAPAAGFSAADLVVLPILHGPLGEDGTVQGMLELAGVPYVGSGVLGSAMAMDKAVAKQMFDVVGIPQARWLFRRSWELSTDVQLDQFSETVASDLGWPVFVKPANMGSSVGVSKAHDSAEFAMAVRLAMQFDDTVVVDEAIIGREVEFAVLGNEHPEVSLPGEVFPAKEFYDFEDKYVDGNATFQIPADFPLAVIAEGQETARRAYAALRCEGMSRVDFFYESNGRGWLVNEINTIPGFTPISMYPKMWEASGVSYPELIDRLIELAKVRHARRSVYAGRARLR
jgi:D-alanine-D-alanine ligase